MTLPNRNERQENEVQVPENVEREISLNEQKQLIIQYVQENGSVTRKEVEDLIGSGTGRRHSVCLKSFIKLANLSKKEAEGCVPTLSNKCEGVC